jgi:uncharacterized protein YraI
VRNYRSRLVVVLLVFVMAMALVVPIHAQSSGPSISVNDQVSDGTVWVASVNSDGPGWVVIRNASGLGTAGPVLGETLVGPGWSYNVPVKLTLDLATPQLFAELHKDDGTAGTFEFGTTANTDEPVKNGDQVVQQLFTPAIIQMDDQFVADDGTVTVNTAVMDSVGWIAIHADNDGKPGAVIGETALKPGRNSNVSVKLSSDGLTKVLWPMLHVDTGTIGTYEFGTVQGADGPVMENGAVAVLPVWTEPHVRADDQIVIQGDGQPASKDPATVTVKSVLSKGPGWIVIHADNNGAPGPVLGYTAVTDGINNDVAVTLDKGGTITPVVWPMLHVDDGVAGTYEFGTVQGADAPVMDSTGKVVTFPINIAPTLVMDPQTLQDGKLTIKEALIDAPGWVAIHVSDNGKPGAVIANYPLLAGVNSNIVIAVDPTKAGDQVFPMLHYDTGTLGTYEFGTVAGADAPVTVNKNVVVAPLSLTGAAAPAPEATAAASASTCSVSPAGTAAVNKRSGASTSADVVGALSAGQTASVIGQAKSPSGATWLTLSDNSWVRADVVKESGDCTNLPTVASSTSAGQPAATPEPATTPAAGS